MTLKEAYELVNRELSDCKSTAESYENAFPGATSAYRPWIKAYTIAAAAIQRDIEIWGEDYEPESQDVS